MEGKEQIRILFRKYLDGHHTEEELDEILRYFQVAEQEEGLVQLIEQELDTSPDADAALIASMGDQIAHNLFKQTRPANIRKLKRWIPYAAALLLCCSAGVAIYLYKLDGQAGTGAPSMTENTILPGANRATVKLADGQVLTLSEDHEEIISKDDALAYADGSAIEGTGAAQLITLTTPRAGQYAVTLSDGTKVWLNAASELIYPTRFEGDERTVQVKGEAYFDVAHDQGRPFMVHTEKQHIHVLGTQFNVHAYADETEQHTTLVQGTVMVEQRGDQQRFRLKPGQQAVSSADDGLSILKVDPSEYVSWKDGIIILHNDDLPDILRQLERWYDVEFGELPAGVKSTPLFGMIDRNVPLNDVLKTLSDNYNTIQFKINGRRITISEHPDRK